MLKMIHIRLSAVVVICFLIATSAASRNRWHTSYSSGPRSLYDSSQPIAQRIVLTVEDRASYFNEWQKLIENMVYGSKIDVIYGSFDAPLTSEKCAMLNRETLRPEDLRNHLNDSTPPILVCLPIVGTTYTPGRNALAKTAFKLQEVRGEAYKYWFLVDGDTRHLRCAMCEGAIPENSCCMDSAIEYMLLDSVKHASISLSTYAVGPDRRTESNMLYYGPPFGQLFHNCFDSQMQSFHWDAVPIYFPYFEDLEGTSWHLTHSFSFYLSVACIPGATIVLGGYTWSNLEHSQYPRGRVTPQLEMAVLKRSVPDLYYMLKPTQEDFKGYQQGDCAGLRVGGWQDPNFIYGNHRDNGWWRQSTRYLTCMHTLRARFDEYMRAPDNATAVANGSQGGDGHSGDQLNSTNIDSRSLAAERGTQASGNTSGNTQPSARRLLTAVVAGPAGSATNRTVSPPWPADDIPRSSALHGSDSHA